MHAHVLVSRLGLALALAALACGACSTQESEKPSGPSFGPGVLVRVGNDPALPASFSGVAIDIVSGVKYETVLVSIGDKPETLATLNGHQFRVEGDWITIGPTRYGPVAPGDKVTIDEHGVQLNGQLAGALPPRKEAAAK